MVESYPSSLNLKMSESIDDIFKSLRLLPEFDGNPNILTRFIRLCDQLVIRHVRTEPGHDFENQALLNGILNKITGPAARLINSNGIPSDWQGIKNSLINNFADQRDETALYNDLALQSQGHSTPQEFYERCQTLFSTIMTYVTLHDDVNTTIEAKRQLYKKLTLQSYLRGLKEPLGSRIRCMRPRSIEQALEFVQEEMNILYLQQRNNDHTSDKKTPSMLVHQPPPKPLYNPPIYMPPNKPFTFNMQMPGPSRPNPVQMPQHPQHWRPFPVQPQMQRGPTRTQQMFRALPPSYNPQNNAFKMPYRNNNSFPSNSQSQAPKPMSGVSHFVPKHLPPSGHDWRKFGNPPPSNYFKTREMNYNLCHDYEYGPYCENYSDYYRDDPECYYENGECSDNYYNSNCDFYYSDYPENVTNAENVDESLVEDVSSSQPEVFRKASRSDKPK